MKKFEKWNSIKPNVAFVAQVCCIGLLLTSYCLLPTAYLPGAAAAPAATVRNVPSVWVIDSPAITIAAGTVDTAATPSTGAHEAHYQWTFGTVAGTYTTCTVQLKTSYDGTNYLTLGSAQAITVTSGTVNAFEVYQVLPSTSAAPTVVQSSTSATVALAFGQLTKGTLACSGAYGTSAPVTITAIYR